MRTRIGKIFLVLAIVTWSVPASASGAIDRLVTELILGGSVTGFCYNYLDRSTYNSGFSSSDFDSMASMQIVGGHLKLDNNRRALDDPNHITIPVDQHLKIKYVYEGADMAQMLGYFIFDNRAKRYFYQAGWVVTYRSCSTDSDCQPDERCIPYGSGRRCMYPHYLPRDSGVTTATGTSYGTFRAGASNGLFDWIEAIYQKPNGSTSPYEVPYLMRPIPSEYFYQNASWSWKTWVYIFYPDAYHNYYHHDYIMNDGGNLRHVSNFLEWLVATGGRWIYLNTDDDRDTSNTWGWPIGWFNGLKLRGDRGRDRSSAYDGVPDYDVNGDGVINWRDRTVDLGWFSAGTELVFFINNFYYNYDARYETVAMHRPSSRAPTWVRTLTIPYFSKHVMNPDFKPSPSNPSAYDTSYISYRGIDIGMPQFNSRGRPNIYYIWVGGRRIPVVGWLTQEVLNRLNSAAYNYIRLPREVKVVYTTYKGLRRHIMVGAPSSDPTRWILGFEQLYDSGNDDLVWTDYNDVVFVVERTNGGQAVSDIVSGEIPSSQLGNTTITKVKLCKRDNIPKPPCSDYPNTRIDYYVSINEDANGDPIWIKVDFPPGQNCTTLDLAALGYTGAKLRWKVVVITDVETCEPEIYDVDIGYEAMVHGDYAFSSPLPLANVLFKGSLETPSSSWTITGNDTQNRGHYRLIEIYDPKKPQETTLREQWDAGEKLRSMDPSSRTIYTQKGGTRVSFNPYKSGFDSWVYWQVLNSADRNETYNGQKVYDLYKDGVVDNRDALKIIRWHLGWEEPPYYKGWTGSWRAWKLAAIHRSVAAVVHVPGKPAWLYGNDVPASLKNSYMTWADGQQKRRTVVLVGAQDGMLHAFDAGAFRWGDNPNTSVKEYRGYFAFRNGKPDYGTGQELWAWIPPTQLNYLKNNYVRNYKPESHPWAMVDGSVALEDVLYRSHWTTAAFFVHGVNHPYLSALDVTNPTDPKPMWDHDWTDTDYNGTYQPPAVGWLNSSRYGGQGKTWALFVTSGMSDAPGDVFLYVIDVDYGNTLKYGKIKLNRGSGSAGAQTLGVWGSPVALDVDGNGYIDRVYVADANGRVWKHYPNGSNYNVCLVADVGQPIFSTPAFKIAKDASTGKTVVLFYFGTSDHPEKNDTAHPPYAFYGFADRDGEGQCHRADLIYKYDLPPDEKVWGDPFISGDKVYFATATGAKADICDEDPSNPGHIYALSLEARPDGLPVSVERFDASGNVVTGVFVYDEHLFVNTLGGKTKIIGNNSWNNPSAASVSTNGVQELYWREW